MRKPETIQSVAAFVGDLANQPRIPARDDAAEFVEYRRPRRFLELLAPLGVNVEGARVADLGTGFGSTAIECARAGAREVIAFDANAERLALVERRAEEAGVALETRRVNLLEPPAVAVEADIGFLVGVVEYAGLWNEHQRPADLQRRVFETARAILKPGGILVFGSKNRIWPRFVVDDVHTHMPLVNVLPRPAADALSRRLRGVPYRHHLHGPRGWERLLRDAGFQEVRTFRPYFSYQLPVLIPDTPRLSDLRRLRALQMPQEERRAALGRKWVAKAMLMGAAGQVGVPFSHSVLMIART